MKKARINLICSAVLLLLFIVFTLCVMTVDVAPAGFEGSKLGFSKLNKAAYDSIGKNSYFAKPSDAFMMVAIIAAAVFAVIGHVQLIKRKKFLKVDPDILFLGAVYILVVVFYGVFEVAAINFRPEAAEASYPSSHTFIVITVAVTAAMFAARKIKDKKIYIAIYVICISAAALTAICRLCSGEHWTTDIIGGALLGSALATLYAGLTAYIDYRNDNGGSK